VPANGRYDLVVSGPGAFYRRLSGDAGAAHAAPEVRAAHGGFGDECVRLVLANEGSAPLRLTVAANAYSRAPARHIHLAPGATVEEAWSVGDTYGWYDLSVTCDTNPAFLRRLAGRVENGKARVSDPATA
jgi:phospholipase C